MDLDAASITALAGDGGDGESGDTDTEDVFGGFDSDDYASGGDDDEDDGTLPNGHDPNAVTSIVVLGASVRKIPTYTYAHACGCIRARASCVCFSGSIEMMIQCDSYSRL